MDCVSEYAEGISKETNATVGTSVIRKYIGQKQIAMDAGNTPLKPILQRFNSWT